jgi:hypothetical protein
LISTILKAKYYPNSSFLDAKLGCRPSFAWRSVFNARDLLLQGVMWRVGDGRSIKVWGDKWLPTPTTFAVQSPPKILAKTTLVADSIDHGTKGWNIELIQDVFSEDEARVIVGIPLSSSLPPNRMVWRGTTNGSFTVKSAYHLGKEIQALEEGQCSHVEEGVDVWKAIWALQVLNSVKLFMWRARHNLLPTKINLVQKKVVDDSSCPCCGMPEETLCHALWECPTAQDV